MKSLISFEEKLTIGDFSPVFSCIRSLKDSGDHLSNFLSKDVDPGSFDFLKNEDCLKNRTGFCLAISIHDGSTLFISSNISQFLGYPKDMLLGQCITNFLYPQDRLTFSNQLSQGLQARFKENGALQSNQGSTFFCRIRQYHSLKRGFGVTDKKVRYKAFQFVTSIKNVSPDEEACAEEGAHSICLIASITPVVSAYRAPEEIPTMSSFSTRHTADCHFSHVDACAIPYLGFLPQDIIGFSIFDFYHMDDMPQLKDIYELVVREQGNSFRSKPYRFRVSNGNYIFLETEWSCFINPWSRKLEFVVGQHRVLKGPLKPNVFGDNIKEECVLTDEILKESLRIQEEIKFLLIQPVKGHAGDGAKHRCQKRKRRIASFVSSLVEDMCQGRVGNVAIEKGSKEECSCSDHDSVVMGEISPHQEYNGSDTASMTPETSQEIRFQENIERFFASQPKTYSSSDGSGEIKSENCQLQCSTNSSFDESGKISVVDSGNESLRTKSDSLRPADMSQASSSCPGSGGSITQNFVSRNSLTEENLTQHNRMTQKQQQRKQVKLNANANLQHRKEIRLKRGASPQRQENAKHNKSSKIWPNEPDSLKMEPDCPAPGSNPRKMSGNKGVPSQPPGPVPLQPAGHFPMGPFSSNSPFQMFGAPIMTQAATSMPWSNSSTSSFNTPSYNTPSFNNAPAFGMPPQFCYVPGANPTSNGSGAPFFMPVMYFGAMPFYPSMSPMLSPSNTAMWPTFLSEQQQQPPCSVPQSVANNLPASSYNNSSYGGSSNPQYTNNSNPQYSHNSVNSRLCTVPAPVNLLYQNCDRNKRGVPSKVVYTGMEESGTAMSRSTNEDRIKNPKDITSFSGTVRDQASPPFMIMSQLNKKEGLSAEANAKANLISNLDDDSGYPQPNRRQHLRESERDSVSMTSTCYLLKSDDLSSGSPSDKTEIDLEMEFKEEPEKRLGPRVPKDPPWMEGLHMNPEVVFRYQLPTRSLDEVLKKDLQALEALSQPDMVNKQLALLKAELAAEREDNSKTGMEAPLAEEKMAIDQEREEQPVSNEGLSKDQAQTSSENFEKEIDLGFTTMEDDIGEELQAKEDAVLHLMGGNM